MSLSSWRQFPFFDCVPIKDPNYGAKDGKVLYSDSTLSALCATPQYLVIAASESLIKFVDQSFQLQYSFTAYEPGWTVTKMCHVSGVAPNGAKGSGGVDFLCTIAEKQGKPCHLKLWNMGKLLGRQQVDYNTDFKSSCQVSNGSGSNNYPLTCFDRSIDFSVLAFGFANGTVVLVRGDLLHDRGSRQRVVFESEEPVTSVHFRDESLLFVTTVSKVVTITTAGRNRGQPDTVLEDKQGSDINCSDIVIRKSRKSLVVARPDALQFYNSRGKTNSLLLDIPKKRLSSFDQRYVLLLTATQSKIAGSQMSTNSLLVVDIIDKYIAFNRTIPSPAIEVFSMWQDLYVYTSDGTLYKLHEKPLQEKLDILVQRELFPEAIKLAEETSNGASGETTEGQGSQDPETVDRVRVEEIENKYGDFLYAKGNPGEAIEEYIKCIELGNTSSVIQKYKESSKIQYLTKYLEMMIETNHSTKDHVTLLLSSYSKLKQDDKIRSFVDSVEVTDDYEVVDEHRDFDKPTVIRLCRESAYYKLAAYIAKKFNLASVVVDIQLKDIKSPKSAIEYIKGLPIDDLLRVLMDNVQTLLVKMPNEMTQLLIDVFTGRYKPDTSFDIDQMSTASSSTGSKLSSVATTTTTTTTTGAAAQAPMVTSYKQFVGYMSGSNGDAGDTSSSHVDTTPTYLPPKPRIIFQCFVNNPNEFVIFLEACVESYDKFGGNEKDKKDIVTTLYEMYLSLSDSPSTSPEEKLQWQSKAKSLLQTIQASKKPWSLGEKMSLLLLSNVAGYNEGEILIRENNDNSSEGFGVDLFRSAVMSDNYERSYEIMEKYGDREPDLYRTGITVYTSRESIYERIGEERILNLIDKIEANQLMTPLELIKLLSRNSNNFVKLGLVKNYLINYIKRQKLEINNNVKLIDAYEKDARETEKGVENLLQRNQTVNQPRCSACAQPLDLPIVHFKCGHTYHEHCILSSSEGVDDANSLVCPQCASDYDSMAVLQKQQQETGTRNDLFKAALEGSDDRFKVMMGFIGRGAMEPTRVLYQKPEEL